MFIIHVFVHVKPDCVETFRAATLDNARNSVLEPGIARFDVVQQLDDPTRFCLVEVYRTPEDQLRHRETAHYATWRDTVAELDGGTANRRKILRCFSGRQRMGLTVRFEFATAARILFGPGTAAEIPAEAASLGKKPLVVAGANGARRYASLIEALGRAGLEPAVFCVPGEPDTELIEQGATEARRAGCDLVVAIGGGSVLDAGKAIAALLINPGELMDYLEVVGRARSLERPAAPCVTVPTTAGTGAEVTRNAVLTSKAHRVKVSMRSPSMLPRLAVVDPELTLSLPADVTAETGLDALTQLIEAFTCNAPNPMTDGFCREGIERAAKWLRRACEAGDDLAARENMAVASLLSGLALANARLGAVHGFAGPIGGLFPAPHGAVCARLLPGVMETNCRALETRAPDSPARMRYTELARLLTGHPDATAADGVAWVRALCADLGVRPLGAFGVRSEDIPAIVAQAGKASSMKGNPIALSEEELTAALTRAL